MQLNVAFEFLPRTKSVRAAQVMDHFGIGFEQGEHVIARGLDMPLRSGQVVLFTGASGSGKSSLLAATANGLQGQGDDVLDLNAIVPGDGLIVDQIPLPLDKTFQLLNACGLGEAHLMLRTPQELSEGQRRRFLLAWGLARSPGWILWDEFTATLDRTLAKAIAFNMHRLSEETGVGFLLATTHDDIVADLGADVHVRCGLNGLIEMDVSHATDETEDRKKKEPARCSTGCTSLTPPSRTGRTSLGGIIAATISD